MRRGQQVSRHYVAQSAQEFRPTQLSGCVLWLRADLGITLGGTLKAAGTTPPVLTISGTPTGLYGLHIRCSLAGALGTWTFDWSIDNGATYVQTGVLSAATVVLGATGITLAIAAGNAALNNTWDATVSQWNDQSGNAHHVTQATASLQPVLTVAGASYAAKPILDMTAGQKMASATWGVALAQPFTAYVVAETGSSANYRLYWGDSVSANGPFAKADLTNNDIALVAGVGKQITSTTTGAAKRVICMIANGVSSSIYVDSYATAGASGDAGALSLSGTVIGDYQPLTLPLTGKAAEYAFFSGAHSSASRARVMQYLASRYGSTLT